MLQKSNEGRENESGKLKTILMPSFIQKTIKQEANRGAFLMVQWLRICLAMQGTQVQSLIQGDSHMLQNNQVHEPQLQSKYRMI